MNISISKILFILYFLSTPVFAQTGFKQTGWASYYAAKFQGRKTSNGERFDNKKLTAAHRKLPFNSMVKVTNLSNKKTVIVRINDRGPYAKKRIIDLSKAAADAIGITQKGTAKVKLEVVGTNGNVTNNTPSESPLEFNNADFEVGKTYELDGKDASVKGYGVQIISGKDFAMVRDKGIELFEKGIEEIVIEVGIVNNQKVFRLMAGECTTQSEATTFLKTKLKPKGYTGFVKQYL